MANSSSDTGREPPVPGSWAAPLPDFSHPAVEQRLRVGDRVYRIAVTGIQHRVPFEPDTDVIQLGVFLNGSVLTAHDLSLSSPEASTHAWAYLTNRVTETVVQFYAPRPRPTGEPNPRLGCWGARPDLKLQGVGESDAALGVVLGVSVWLPGSHPPEHEELVLEALRDTLSEVLSYWTVVAQRLAMQQDRRN